MSVLEGVAVAPLATVTLAAPWPAMVRKLASKVVPRSVTVMLAVEPAPLASSVLKELSVAAAWTVASACPASAIVRCPLLICEPSP